MSHRLIYALAVAAVALGIAAGLSRAGDQLDNPPPRPHPMASGETEDPTGKGIPG